MHRNGPIKRHIRLTRNVLIALTLYVVFLAVICRINFDSMAPNSDFTSSKRWRLQHRAHVRTRPPAPAHTRALTPAHACAAPTPPAPPAPPTSASGRVCACLRVPTSTPAPHVHAAHAEPALCELPASRDTHAHAIPPAQPRDARTRCTAAPTRHLGAPHAHDATRTHTTHAHDATRATRGRSATSRHQPDCVKFHARRHETGVLGENNFIAKSLNSLENKNKSKLICEIG